MRNRIAAHHNPLAASVDVLPEFAMQSTRVPTHENVVGPPVDIGVIMRGPLSQGITAIIEFAMITQSAARAFNTHFYRPSQGAMLLI